VKRGNPELRLRLPRIEKKPKLVYLLEFQDFASVSQRPDLQDELDEIIESIERGGGVPEAYYRAGIDRDKDGLLDDKGIMHLHLGGKNSPILVFLVQYSDQVVLLETNTHLHFRTKPAGKNILALSQSWLGNLEQGMEEAARQAETAGLEEERKEAMARRDAIAASIAAFKASVKTK
jgi:hypothetical protein